MEILNVLNREFNSKYDYLRVLKVEYNTLLSCTEIWFLYPENKEDLSAQDKMKISEFIKNKLGLNCQIKIKFKKSYLDEDLIKKHLMTFLKTNYSSIFVYYDDNNIQITRNQDNINVIFHLTKTIFNYFNYNNLKVPILKDLNKNFIANFAVDSVEDVKENIDENVLIQREEEVVAKLPKPKKVERYEVFEPVKLFGVDITPMPEMIINQKEEKISVILAGKISNLVEKTYISRRTKLKGGTEPSYYYSFNLTDHTGTISAVYFSNKTTHKKAINLKDGDSILVIGNIRKTDRGISLTIKSVSYCEIINPTPLKAQKEEVPVCEHKHIDEYKFVHPTLYMPLKQENIFDKKATYNDYVMKNQFVVFDVETTGLSCEENEIIEIGAVKIIDGKIKYQFQTFICPENEIPEEITNLTSITNEMVKNAPSNNQAITDFYKFCENCILVGYNVSFDIGFIKKSGEKANLLFDNETYDAMVLAKNKLYLPRYKLINVVEYLKLELNNAHRAIADAIATADVFLKLSEI